MFDSYNNPYSAGYANPYFPQFANRPAQPQMQPTQALPNTPVVLYVASVKDFSGISVQPGRQVLAISQNEPYMALKSADMMGQIQTSLYHIDSVTEEQMAGPQPEYATKAEVAKLEQIVQQIVEGLSNNRSQRVKKEGAPE